MDTKYFQQALRTWLKECDDDTFAQVIIDIRKFPTAILSMLLRRAHELKEADRGQWGSRTHN
jgi:hypothetical protein